MTLAIDLLLIHTVPTGTLARPPRNVPEATILRTDKAIIDPHTVGDIFFL